MHTRHSSDLVDILNTLDRLNLRDDAHVVVAGGHVVAVVGVQRGITDAGCECPGAEGAVANGR